MYRFLNLKEMQNLQDFRAKNPNFTDLNLKGKQNLDFSGKNPKFTELN